MQSGFEVRPLRDPRFFVHTVRDLQYRGYYEVQQGTLTDLTIVLVAPELEAARYLAARVSRAEKPIPGVRYRVGVVSEDLSEGESEFVPVA